MKAGEKCILCPQPATLECGVCKLGFCGLHFTGADHVAAHTPQPADPEPVDVDAAQKVLDGALAFGPARLRTVREALAACELAASLLRAVVRSAPGGRT